MTRQERIARATDLAELVRHTAREIIMPRYLASGHQRKADGSFFTETDLLAQQTFTERLKTLADRPTLGEEMNADEQAKLWQEGADGLWCIDPIDGTTNFIHGIPFFAVSIAYLVGGESEIGVVYNPVTDEAFFAARGAGALLNGAPLPHNNPTKPLRDAVAGVDFKRISHRLGDELAVRPPYYSQRNFGASSLEWCYVAAGRLDVYLHGGQRLWDYAAGRLILAEAGGEFCTLEGGALSGGPAIKRSVVAASGPSLFAEWRTWLTAHV